MPRHHPIDIFLILIVIFSGSLDLSVAESDRLFVRKCCPMKFDYVNLTCVPSENDFKMDFLLEFNFAFEFLIGRNCSSEMNSILLQASDLTVSFRIVQSGDLQIRNNETTEAASNQAEEAATVVVKADDYCLDFINEDQSGLSALVCLGNEDYLVIEMVYGMIISMPFLLITFLVYALLPDRNLHQRALMFYVLSLLIAYILLVTINLAPNIPTWFWCKFLGYSTLFFFMVSFFWMNVICFDIWYTFSGGRGFMGSKRTSERRRLIFYSLYANGVPLLIVAWTYGMQISLPNECEHNPGIGVAKCFLATGWASLWYFYLEAGIVVIANITFFILTALRIRKVKQETSMLKHNDSKRHTYEKDKQKFNLYVKLLFAMGVNWSMEVISWLVNWNTKSEYQYIWYATDFFNAVYGVFIFFIFVFKKKIWTLLQRRYYNFIGRPHLAHTVTSSNTRSSHYSSTNYSTADTGLSERATAVNGRQPAEEMALRRVT
ncbi:G-protein coupled receptor Mth2 isoform X5 [Dendroctonus ponderosae]|uniref:G-protein coupled receptor Mth2 isoform X5 n=1 Tax=Dendroctonus ponderosae TaxID=77166 RepID=UPI0020360BFA|nr:G-protein coupled receptor Mth2 isoform X5 [Dendroctonus ponderosae]